MQQGLALTRDNALSLLNIYIIEHKKKQRVFTQLTTHERRIEEEEEENNC